MKNLRFLIVFALLTGHATVNGQNYSNKGKDFYITYPMHIDSTFSVMGIYITSDVNAIGTVTVGTQTLPFTVTANTVTKKFIGGSTCTSCDALSTGVYLSQKDGITTGGAIHVVSDNPVVVYAHIIKTSRSGATLVLPSAVWGKQYIVSSYNNVGRQSNTPYGYGAITVVAAEANTTVQITPAVDSRNGARLANVPFQITLANPGDVYQIQFKQNLDISGTTVQSFASGSGGCKKIAVFSSTSWSAFGCQAAVNGSGDNLYQQLFPTGAWGKNFLTAPAKTRGSDIFRVFVTDPATVVKKTENGVTTTLTGLVNNSFYEYATGNPTYIETNKPSSVVQYFTTMACLTGAQLGDPEMVVLNPVEQTINNITVFSAHKNFVPSNQSSITNCYLNVIIRSNATSSFKISGNTPAAPFIAIPGTDYSYLQEEVTSIAQTNPVQTLSADSSFSAIAYGFGSVESYGYNAGTNVKDFTQVASFLNPYLTIDSAVTCINTPVKFRIPLNFQPSSVKWDFSSAPGISPNTIIGPVSSPVYDTIRDVNGQTLYYYSPGQTFKFSNTSTANLQDTIKLYTTSTTPDGCGSTDQLYTIPVKVNDRPVAGFTFTTSGCVTDSVLLTDKSINNSGKLSRWLWNFGDGNTADRLSGTPFSIKYSNGAGYVIKLQSVSDIGCISDEVSKTIQISAKPIAKFSYTAIACTNSDIVFTDASTTATNTITKWTWDLDDGAGAFTNTSNVSPKTKYGVYGSKSPNLQVETSTGCKSDLFAPTGFKVHPLPDVGFILPEVCLSDANALFTDTSSIAEGSIAAYLWNFNAGTPPVTKGPDMATSTLKNPLVTYKDSANYKVSLTVSSAAGCVAAKVQDFTVNGANPKAAFDIISPTPYCGTKPVQLKNNSTVDFGNITKLEIYWDLVNNPTVKEVDETPAPGKIYPHSYPAISLPTAQSYTIKLVAYSGGNTCVDFVTQTISVYPQPKAAFTVSASQLCFGETVSFTDKSNGVSSAASSWVWDMGKGDRSTAQNPSKQFNDSGSLTISMCFFNADGCVSDTVSQSLTVYPNPVLVLTHKMQVLIGGAVTIVPQLVYGNDLQYLWTPSTYLNSDTAAMPKAVPEDDITYKLTLTARGGCTVSDTVYIRVLKAPDVPNAFSPNGDGINDTWRIKYLDGYPGATVDVYNRYGQIVFRSLGYEVEWNGTYNGKPLPVGTYYYIINPKNGRQIVTGSVTIIK